MMSDAPSCPECGSPIPENAPEGHCPPCLLALATRAVAGSSAPAMWEFEGSSIGSYEILERIGEGGMGVVYKARHEELGRTVALKMIRSGPHASDLELQRFRSEAQAGAGLRHPNVVAIHEVGEHEGRPFFSMDYVDGDNLAEVARRRPLSAQRAVRYVKVLAEAVQYAHENGILHRDLKPANVLIDAEDQPRITDFGLAKQLELESDLTASGDIMGTPSYTPPEQAEGRRGDIGPVSDVYSLGAILYDLLTGRPPFRGETPLDTLRQVTDTEPVSPRLLNAKVPRDLETICLKCLAKEPRQRYDSARELSEEMGRFLNGEPIRARPVSAVTRVWRWALRKPSLAGLTGLLALMFLLNGVAAVLFRWEIHQVNLGLARVRANKIGAELETLRDEVKTVSRDPSLRLLLRQFTATGDKKSLEDFLKEKHSIMNRSGTTWMGEDPFHSLNLFDAGGNLLARWPIPEVGKEKVFYKRDYFEGAMEEGSGPYISKVYRSKTDPETRDKFGIGMRIDGVANSPFVFMASVTAASVTAEPPVTHGFQPHAVVLGRWDPSDDFRREGWVIVAHSSYDYESSTEAIGLNRAPVREDEIEGAGFYLVDSASSIFAGPWLVSFRAIADTPFVVMEQTRDWVVLALITAVLLGMFAGAGFFMWRWIQRRPG